MAGPAVRSGLSADAIKVEIRDEGMVRNKPVLSFATRAMRIALGPWEQNEGAKFWL